jgi:hypothetical protein
MSSTNHTPNLPSRLPELEVPAHLTARMHSEMTTRNTDIRSTYAYVSTLPKSRLARHAVLVNARHVLAYDIIDFYSRRYNGVPAQAPAPAYTAADAVADIRAAGLPHHMERVITKSAKTRPEVLAAIDAYRDDIVATRARNAAKWTQMQASAQAVVA